MISGLSFQPGQTEDQIRRPRTPQESVQEAIKVLSLRLPKVVGAQGLAPSPLLRSPGSNSNPRIDSVVNQILARYFGTPSQALGPMGPQYESPEPPITDWPPDVSTRMPTLPPVRFEDRDQQPDWTPRPPGPPRFIPGEEEPLLPPEPPMPTWEPPRHPFQDLQDWVPRPRYDEI